VSEAAQQPASLLDVSAGEGAAFNNILRWIDARL
jgi:hypothetical protein